VTPYRPVVSYRSGNRTLVYPPVAVSTLRHQTHSGRSNFNSGYAIQRAGNSPHLSRFNTTADTKLDPQTSTRLRNWSGNIDSVSRARLNHLDHCHHHHGSNWWRNHCLAIVFFEWGWYDGWWYPA
jgi:hypothetical protein